jgi:hypothetical protein
MCSRLEPLRKRAKTIRAHWDGVVAFSETRVTNGLIRAITGLFQLAKRMARGFRHFKIMAYLKAAQLKPDLPAVLPARNSEEVHLFMASCITCRNHRPASDCGRSMT